MKIVRSTKCSIKFATKKKKYELNTVLKEYGKVVNIFISYFWDKPEFDNTQLLKPIVDIPIDQTWLSARLRKVAAREALGMVPASRTFLNGIKSNYRKVLLGWIKRLELLCLTPRRTEETLIDGIRN